MKLKMYTRPDCRLCDVAWEILQTCGTHGQTELVNIEGDPDLLDRYSHRIPVVHEVQSNREIGWPFSCEQFRRWLSTLED